MMIFFKQPRQQENQRTMTHYALSSTLREEASERRKEALVVVCKTETICVKITIYVQSSSLEQRTGKGSGTY